MYYLIGNNNVSSQLVFALEIIKYSHQLQTAAL